MPDLVTDSIHDDPNTALGENGKKALQAERDARKAAEKALADAQTAWETEKASLTALLSEATQTATTAQADAARVSVFRDKDIPKELEKFVQGASVEELAASADEVLAAFHPQDTPPTPDGNPDPDKPLGMRPDLTQGATSVALNGDELEQSLRAAVGIN